ncbi:MAG: hypothetical protein WBP29_13710 [Candidatus Zixiibacteriota bacterium]
MNPQLTPRSKRAAILSIAALSLLLLFLSACSDHGVTIIDDGGGGPPPPDPTVFFAADVHPILMRTCAFNSCHGEVNPQHDLKVTTYTDITKVSPIHGRIVIAGDAGVSALYIAVSPRYRELGLDFRMPRFSDTLTTAEQDTIRIWIDEGALDN